MRRAWKVGLLVLPWVFQLVILVGRTEGAIRVPKDATCLATLLIQTGVLAVPALLLFLIGLIAHLWRKKKRPG